LRYLLGGHRIHVDRECHTTRDRGARSLADAKEKLTPFVRYFCAVTSCENPEVDNWGDIGWDYFQALVEKFPMRVFANGLMHQVHVSKGSRWSEYANVFGTPIPNRYVNVVCGDEAALSMYWTKGVVNVAITSSLKDIEAASIRRREVIMVDDAIRKYDLVACLTEAEAVALREQGVIAKHLQPDELTTALLERMTSL